MEKQQEDILIKTRSYRGVITTGLRLYTSSFRKIFKATWSLTLLHMVIMGIFGALFTTRLLPVLLQMKALPDYRWLIAQDHWPLLLASFVLLVAAFSLLILIVGMVADKLREHKDTSAILMPSKWFGKPTRFRALSGMLKAAGRHWLLTLGILLVGFIVITPICLFVGLPVIILLVASIQAQLGTLMGDPLGMPSYLSWMAGGTWLLAAFLIIYIILVILFVGYYAYGSAESQQKEREQQKLSITS